MGVRQEFLHPRIARLHLVDDRVDFHPIAGGQQDAFLHARIGAEPAEGFPQAAVRHRQLLTDFHGRGLVAEPDDNDVHGVRLTDG